MGIVELGGSGVVTWGSFKRNILGIRLHGDNGVEGALGRVEEVPVAGRLRTKRLR